MKSRIALSFFVALCLMTLLGATLVTPVQAAQPIPFSDGGSYIVELVDCGGVLIIYDEYTWETGGLNWYESDGGLIKFIYQERGYDRLFTNQNDKEIQPPRITINGIGYYSPEYGQVLLKIKGQFGKVMVPGYGMILHPVGQVSGLLDGTILKITPNAESFFEGDYSAICDYFESQ
jgi:hypothetical protein